MCFLSCEEWGGLNRRTCLFTIQKVFLIVILLQDMTADCHTLICNDGRSPHRLAIQEAGSSQSIFPIARSVHRTSLPYIYVVGKL